MTNFLKNHAYQITIVQVSDFKYLRCGISYDKDSNISEKLAKFSATCNFICKTIGKKIKWIPKINFVE